MAIAPKNYPFSGGAFMGGANTPVEREDIHTLTLTKDGRSLGQYNPLIGDASIEIPSEVVQIALSSDTVYDDIIDTLAADKVPVLTHIGGSGGGGSYNEWYAYSGTDGDSNEVFFRIDGNTLEILKVTPANTYTNEYIPFETTLKVIYYTDFATDRASIWQKIQQAEAADQVPVLIKRTGGAPAYPGRLVMPYAGSDGMGAVYYFRSQVDSSGQFTQVAVTSSGGGEGVNQLALDSYIKKATYSQSGWISNWASTHGGGSFGANTLGVVCGSGNNKCHSGGCNAEVNACGCLDCGMIVFLDFTGSNALKSDEAINISGYLTINLSTASGTFWSEDSAKDAIPDQVWIRVFKITDVPGGGYSHEPLNCGAMFDNGLLVNLDTVKFKKSASQNTQGDYSWIGTAYAKIQFTVIGDVMTFTYVESN